MVGRPHARARRRPALAADGADHRPGQLAGAQRRQAAGAVPAAGRCRPSPGAPTRCCTSSGGSRRPARRSGTRRWSATTAQCGPRWRRSVPSWPGWPTSPAGRSRPGRRSSSPGRRWWAQSQPAQPAAELDHLTEARRWYGAAWDEGITRRLRRPGRRPAPVRRLVVAADGLPARRRGRGRARRVRRPAAGRCWSAAGPGWWTSATRCRPAATRRRLRDLLGVTVAEHLPLAAPATVRMDGADHPVEVWSERLVPDPDTEVLGPVRRRRPGRRAGGDPARRRVLRLGAAAARRRPAAAGPGGRAGRGAPGAARAARRGSRRSAAATCCSC